ncbi:peptidoglycan recognition protein family protein [Streptomyces sp. NBC_00334]|uniref:peptidoglycan recognition protein family protein n=1 Tax=Streptomyces sp. NBC_00334 TaxID=2975713 RepID=UPI002E2CB0A1|nr:N-acetylmuramoyl-L-alanine amidase [Streptomyces sp. NBC_00334]
MATPMTPATFLSALRAEGLRVVEVGNWQDHNRNHKGPWGPMHGVMIHHTVTKGTARTVEICRAGHSDLPGPLCHGVIAKDGTIYLVGYGRANHAGLGDDDVLQAVINERALPADNDANTDGNRHFYGFECENLGDGGDPWPAAQLEAIERAAAALCRHHGWDERSVIGHLEWQPGKVDPRGFTMASMRSRIHDRLTGSTTPSNPPAPPLQEDDMPTWTTGSVTPGPQPTVALSPRGAAWHATTRRCLHLGMDAIGSTAKASVRVAIHNGTQWRVKDVTVTAAGGIVDVAMTASDEKVSLQTESVGVAYAIEAW